MSEPKKIFWLAAGRSLQAVLDYQAAELAWRKSMQEKARSVLAKYGAKEFSYGGLRFENQDAVDREVWHKDQKFSVWRPRLRTYDRRKVEGGLERRAELRDVGAGKPDWDMFAKGIIPFGHSYVTMEGGHGLLHTGVPGFECIGDAVVLSVREFAENPNHVPPKPPERVPLDCTENLLLWEVEKLRHEAKTAGAA